MGKLSSVGRGENFGKGRGREEKKKARNGSIKSWRGEAYQRKNQGNSKNNSEKWGEGKR